MAESLRDQLTAAYDQHAADTPEPAAPEVEAPAPVEAEPAPSEAKGERPRDPETGKFLPKEKEPKDAAAAESGKSSTPPPPAKDAKTTPAAAATATSTQRPSSWGKDKQALWDTLTPEHQSYITQREREYATGVSTYKTEADRAKEVMQVMSYFEPTLAKHGIQPAQWIRNLGLAHERLALGGEAERTQTFAQLMQQYRVNPQNLFALLSGQQPQYTAQQQQTQQPVDIESVVSQQVQQQLVQREVDQAWSAFSKGIEEGKFPHYDELKPTMARILESELAPGYEQAYEAALAMPQHRHLQATQQPVAATAPAATEQAKVARARSQAVSVKSSTPSAMTPASQGTKSRRDSIADAFDSVMGGGRV